MFSITPVNDLLRIYSTNTDHKKTTQSVHCTITGPWLRMHHRPSARRRHQFGRFTWQYYCCKYYCCK